MYVDDLFVTGTSMRMIEEFKGEMAKRFEMSDLGRLTYYLGIEVKQHEEGITLSQIHYALKILEEAGMRDCNSVHILMEPGLKLAKSETKRDIDATNYKKVMVLSLYIAH